MCKTRAALLGAIDLSALTLAGCGRGKAPPRQDANLVNRAVQVAEDQVRAEAKVPGVRFRGVMPWTQALPGHVAVCGQAAVFGGASETYVPFVSVVAYAPDGGASSMHVEQDNVGSTVDEAGKVYRALVDDCYEKGGPKPPPAQNVASLPPMPNDLPDPAASQAAPAPSAGPRAAAAVSPPPASGSAPGPATGPAPGPAPGGGSVADQAPASGEVTMRQNGNLHETPHGPVARVVQQGTAMKVFAQAPGGWYQVGDTAPWGWIHSSIIEKR